MTNTNPVGAVPIFLELADTLSQPAPGTAGSILRSYLGILVSYFERQRANPNAAIAGVALSNLPGLMLQNETRLHNDITAAPAGLADGLATILASGWSAPIAPSAMLPISRPMLDCLGRDDASLPANNSFEATLIVLQRPPSGPPTLGLMTVNMSLRRDANTPPSSCTLSVDSTRTNYLVHEEHLMSVQKFVEDLHRQGFVASVERASRYRAVPFS